MLQADIGCLREIVAYLCISTITKQNKDMHYIVECIRTVIDFDRLDVRLLTRFSNLRIIIARYFEDVLLLIYILNDYYMTKPALQAVYWLPSRSFFLMYDYRIYHRIYHRIRDDNIDNIVYNIYHTIDSPCWYNGLSFPSARSDIILGI